MTETKLKALMHNGHFVDANLLPAGIIPTSFPSIYSLEITMQDLVQNAEDFKDIAYLHFTDAYFENLAQCELVPVRVIVERENP